MMIIPSTLTTAIKGSDDAPDLSPDDISFLAYSPIKFIEGNFADYIWGGHNLYRLKGLSCDLRTPLAAESWEVSGHKKYPSRVSMPDGRVFTLSGLLKNERLAGLIMGENTADACGGEFPVLAKFVDVHRHMSVHLHPSPETARLLGETDPGKQEVFIVIGLHDKAESALYLGLQDGVKRGDLEAAVAQGRDMLELSHKIQVKPGDIYRIPSGVLHCWTGGSIAVEITETSDLTYRLYDFCRNRPMHIEKGMASFDFSSSQGSELEKKCRGSWRGTGTAGVESVRTANAFCVERVSVNGECVNISARTSFDILMGIEGSMEVFSRAGGWAVCLDKGNSVLVPFSAGPYTVRGNIPTVYSRALRIKMKVPGRQKQG